MFGVAGWLAQTALIEVNTIMRREAAKRVTAVFITAVRMDTMASHLHEELANADSNW
jgi:hypothetical protein